MLEIRKTISMQGTSTIDGKQAATLTASINTDNLDATTIIERQNDVPLCESNKDELRKDAAEFEDAVYAVIDQLAETDSNREDV